MLLIFLRDGSFLFIRSLSTSPSQKFIQSSFNGSFFLHARVADLSFTPEFLAKPSFSLGHPCSRHHSQECWTTDLSLVLISLLTFMFHGALIDYPFLSSKFFIPLLPIGPLVLTSPHNKEWNSLLIIYVRIFLYISLQSTFTKESQYI